jgi:hypothetical protein
MPQRRRGWRRKRPAGAEVWPWSLGAAALQSAAMAAVAAVAQGRLLRERRRHGLRLASPWRARVIALVCLPLGATPAGPSGVPACALARGELQP